MWWVYYIGKRAAIGRPGTWRRERMNGMKLYNFLDRLGLTGQIRDFSAIAADEAALAAGERRTYGDTWSEDGQVITVAMVGGRIVKVPGGRK